MPSKTWIYPCPVCKKDTKHKPLSNDMKACEDCRTVVYYPEYADDVRNGNLCINPENKMPSSNDSLKTGAEDANR